MFILKHWPLVSLLEKIKIYIHVGPEVRVLGLFASALAERVRNCGAGRVDEEGLRLDAFISRALVEAI